MAVEDEGIEPEFEVVEPKRKEKRSLEASGEQGRNGKSVGVKTNASKKQKKRKEKLTPAPALGKTTETSSDMVTQAKKELKRKIAEAETASSRSVEVPKKKKKLMKTQSETMQPVTPILTKKKKKKLLKKKLTEGVPVKDVSGKSLEESIAAKSAEPQTISSDATKKALKKKKVKKRNKEKPTELAAASKLALSSSEPPIPVTEEEKDEHCKPPEEEKKKVKKLKKKKKKIIASAQDDKKEDVNKNEKPKKKKKAKINEEDAEDNNEDHTGGVEPVTAQNPPLNMEKYKDLLERLSSIQKEGVARQKIAEDVTAEKIEESEVMTVLRLWRQQKRRRIQTENKEKLLQMDGTLEEVKKEINDLVRKGKLKSKDAGDIIKRWKAREKRRVDRQISKQTNRTCFNCRQPGHVLADCPNRGDGDQTVGNVATMNGEGICFKCGSTEHKIQKCPRKNVKGFPYATCFVCGQQGHLSRDCEKNANGIYPDGGGCNVCGSTKHLKRDCPELAAQKQQKDERKVTIRTMSAMSSADADEIPEEEPKEVKKKSKKIVRF